MIYQPPIEKSPLLAEVKMQYSHKVPPRDRLKIRDGKDAAEILRGIYDADTIEYREESYCLLLNMSQHVLGWVKIATGTISSCVMDTRMILQAALLANAPRIIVCHNHPSGNLQPSKEDLQTTETIKLAAELFSIKLLDHIILTADDYCSFSERGYM